MKTPVVWTAAAIGLAAPAAVALDLPTPVRLVLVLAFACLVPGSAVLAWFPQRDVVVHAALTVVLGIALTAASSVAMLWADVWHPALGLVALAALSVASLVIAARRTQAVAR